MPALGGAPPTLRDFFAAWDLFRDPLLAGVVAGGTLGYLGVYVVLRRMVFVSAALSQAAGLGVALAFYAQMTLGAAALLGDPLVVATACTLAAMLVLARRDVERRLARESLLGAVYLVGAAGALIVGTRIRQEAHDIQSILFGAAVLVTPADLAKLEAVGAACLALQLVAGRGMRFASFDPDGARISGLPVRLLDLALLASIAVSVSVATRVLGALPVFAFSVLPALAATLVAPDTRSAMIVAAALGMIAAAAGYVAAFLYGWPVGASQTACGAALVVVAGVVARIMERRRTASPGTPRRAG